ncbi:hypothetical protein BH09BAC1_BH09BAC1_30010 [soil metagenome]
MRFYTLILSICIALSAIGQNNSTCDGGRFTDELYQVNKIGNVTYGANQSLWTGNQTLKFDLYEPKDDTLEKRPMIIWAFGGSFLFGNKISPDIVRLCNEFASRGYVCVSIDYRLGISSFDAEHTLQAVMRAVHDMRAAVRFFRKDAATANLYNIDTERIFVGGVSAGAITAIQTAYLNELDEIPVEIVNDTAAVGGIEGLSGNLGYSSKPNLVINLCGAVGDTNWIIPGDIPIVSLHGTSDGTVPYGSEEIAVSGNAIGFFVDGSGSLHVRANNIGLDNLLYTWQGVGHTPFINTSNGAIDEAYMDTVVTTVRDFMQPYACREIIQTVGMQTVADLNDIKVFPNPAEGEVFIEVPKANSGFAVSIHSLQGQLVNSYTAMATKLRVSTELLDAGLYVVTINLDGEQIQRKLVVY